MAADTRFSLTRRKEFAMFKMSALRVLGLVVIVVFGCVAAYYCLTDSTTKVEEKKAKTEHQLVREEIARSEERGNDGQRLYKEKASSALIKMIEADPDFVIVCVGIEQTRKKNGFPEISEQDAERILVFAQKDSAGALRELQKCVYDALTQVIKEYKGTSDKNYRQGWNSNNPATALLFIYVPLAERIGNKKEMIRSRIGIARSDWGKEVPGPHSDWLYGVVWPWPNETPPAYWSGRGWNPVN